MTDFINESDAKRNVTVVAMYSNGASGTSKNSTAISIPGIVFSAHYALQLAYVYIHTSWEASISTFLYSINICIVFKKFILHDSLIQVHALVLLGGMEVNAMKVWAIIHFNHTSDCSVWCVNMGLYMKNLKQLYNYVRTYALTWEYYRVLLFIDPAVCTPPCLNGGHCFKPDMCMCVGGWSASACREFLQVTIAWIQCTPS